MKNYKKDLLVNIQKLLSSVSEEYCIDYFVEDFKSTSWTNLSNTNQIINDTLKKYKEYHEDFEEQRMQPLYEYFQKITKNDIF